MTASIRIGDSLQPEDIQRVEYVMNQEQLNAIAEQYFTQSEVQTFIQNVGQKLTCVLTRKIVIISMIKMLSLPHLVRPLKPNWTISPPIRVNLSCCSIARCAQALCLPGIFSDIIFTAGIQDLNITFFDGLNLENTILFAAMGTPNQIIGLPFREVYISAHPRCLTINLMWPVPKRFRWGRGSVSVIGLSALISFAPQSIVIAGQDLVYDGTAWHSRLTRHKDNFDGAAAGDSSR